MRKGAPVPLSLPAGERREVGWRFNPAPAAPRGRQPFRTHRGAGPGEGAAGLAPQSPPANARRCAPCARPGCGAAGAGRLFFPGWGTNRRGARTAGCPSAWSLPTPGPYRQLRGGPTDARGRGSALVSAEVGGGCGIQGFPGWPAPEPWRERWVGGRKKGRLPGGGGEPGDSERGQARGFLHHLEAA